MQDLWNIFEKTGKVSDYLAFRDSVGEEREADTETDAAKASEPNEQKGETWERTW